MMWLKRSALLCAAATLLAGCGLSPQQVQPAPQLQHTLAVTGQGQAVRIHVSDVRQSEALGARGGIYGSSNTLTLEKRLLLPRLTAEVEVGVRMAGFQPDRAGGSSPSLDVQLLRLNYQVVDGRSAFGEAQLMATYRARASNQGRHYEGEYSAELKKGFIAPPTASANNQLVNQVLSDALQRVFEDPALMRLLAN